MNELIGDAGVLLQSQAAKNQVAFDTELTPGLPGVMGDPIQLQQVMINLALNGIEAMDAVNDRPRELRICSKRGDQDTIVVEIRDHGTGLADPEKAFEAMTKVFLDRYGIGNAEVRTLQTGRA